MTTADLKIMNMTRVSNGDGWQTTTYTMVGHTTNADLVTAVNNIDNFSHAADRFWDDEHEIRSMWLEENADGETERRSLILSMKLTPIQEGKLGPLLGVTGAKYVLTIIHSEVWEKVANGNVAIANEPSLAGTVALAAIDGTYSGRIGIMALDGDAASTSDLTTIWGGIKPVYTALTDFDPLIELELGTLVAPAVTANGGANASPTGAANNIVTYAATTSDVKIIYETLDDAFASVNYRHWHGDYLVLLRCKLSGAETVRVHVDWGYKYGTVFNRGPDVYVTNTDWMFLEMGEVSIPPFPRMDDLAISRYFEFQVYVQRMGAAITLSLDCLVLIPSKHFFKITNALLEDDAASHLYAYQNEDGTVFGYNINAAGVVSMSVQYAPNNFTYPVEGGILVLAAQEAAVQNLADVIDGTLYYKERFRTHGE